MKHLERLKQKTILLIEDETVIRENIAAMLRFFFKEVVTAADGFEGLDQYEATLPDMVMTDLKMPNMGGFELIQELQKRSSRAYTVIVSAHTDTELLIDAIHNGVDRYLVKPVTEAELFAVFEAFLEQLDALAPESMVLGDGVMFDAEQSRVVVEGVAQHLNKKELLLLKLLCHHRDHIFTYAEIEYQVWGSKSMSLPALRSVVRDLRKKVGQEFIINISGVGYRLQ